MKKVFSHLFASFVLFLPALVFAQNIGLQNPIKVNSISELILIVTRVVRYIAIPFVVLAIMYSGWLYIWGSVAAKLNAGPGAAVAETTVAADLTATFTLAPGEYVAYASAYPTRRLFFMVTPE
jgi:hypothetical protein